MTSAISHLTTEFERKISLALESENPEKGIQIILDYLGKIYQSDRSYIFEFHDTPTLSNTYEWCADGVIPQIENLQNESLFHVTYWIEQFERNLPVIITDLEELRHTHPSTYAILKPQQIHSLVAAPFYLEGKIIGFVGLDNPHVSNLESVVQTLYYSGSVLSHLISARKMNENTLFYQYHDSQTHFLNLAALKRDLENSPRLNAVGIIICKVSKTKAGAISFGYDGTDDYAVFQWNSVLKHVFNNYHIYQACPESYVIICENISQTDLLEMISHLKDFTARNSYHLAIGHAWDDSATLTILDVYTNAKNALAMQLNHSLTPVAPSSSPALFQADSIGCPLPSEQSSPLSNFINNNYFNLDTFFQSMSIGGLYPYFGDLTSDLWYISDSMRDLFGFESNIVIDLLHKWEKFIPYKEDLDLYRNDVEKIVDLKKDIHDLVYRTIDKDGNELWVRCFGLISWNKERTIPLSFCGNIFRLNHAFIVDPITNFPREKPAIREIGKLQQDKRNFAFVCFRLNGFSEINEMSGRHIANNLLRDIGQKISKTFDKKILFFRLDGLRFLAILPEQYINQQMEIAQKIKSIVADLYTAYNLPIRFPASFGVLNDISKRVAAQEIMNDVMNVLEISKNIPDEILVHSAHTVRLHRQKKQMLLDLSNNVANQYRNFRLLIQPIVSAQSHEIVGGEVLLRWTYEGSDISPMIFIPILEQSKLILPVGRWIFDQAARVCKRIHMYQPDFFLDFNVSYHQINDEGFLEYMKNTLKKRDLPINHLVMELTETQYNNNPLKLQSFIEDCIAMGIPMALDDFGVGYSSLDMLLKYPAKVVKLDRSLMKKMSDSRDISDFITSIVYACHRFGKLVCVEGVETEKELQIVTEAGCDYIQGFYFYEPMEIEDFYDILAKKSK